MSFNIQDLQALPEREPAGNEAMRLTNCRTQQYFGCTNGDV
ncbi:hypothetical protein GCM10010517_75190 [Streptosporangium fragile]|uniref:Uncharacterized protein n=1 Tax=Streptosporangium fragile TaxID=46186 RepID=A0ABN3WCN2_9ACTN